MTATISSQIEFRRRRSGGEERNQTKPGKDHSPTTVLKTARGPPGAHLPPLLRSRDVGCSSGYVNEDDAGIYGAKKADLAQRDTGVPPVIY